MYDDFEQVVNLKEKVEQQRKERERRTREEAEKRQAQEAEQLSSFKKEPEGRAREKEAKKETPETVRPVSFKPGFIYRLIRFIVIILVLSIAGLTAYSLFFDHSTLLTEIVKDKNWYLVKLVDGEIFYGQILNTKADPIVMLNVYYNYDQAVGGEKDAEAAGGLRLIKRGQETHGPDGTMDIVRSQVLIMERLKNDSAMLQAILEYEKKIDAEREASKVAAGQNATSTTSASSSVLPK